MNDLNRPYTYGKGDYARTYVPKQWHDVVLAAQTKLNADHGFWAEGCFLNGYENERDHLGWHADDSPEIDHARPIASISLYENPSDARAIWFRENGAATHEAVSMAHGSLVLMGAGMQQTHQHRIPKHGAKCGPRISLTFRGMLR